MFYKKEQKCHVALAHPLPSLIPLFNPFFRMSNSRKQKWRGAGGRRQMPWGRCCTRSSAKTPMREAAGEEDDRGIVERHGWMEMYGSGGGLALARWGWRVAEGGCCQREAPLESLWASVTVWGLKPRFSENVGFPKDQEWCNRWFAFSTKNKAH